jgi:hypothetical protein
MHSYCNHKPAKCSATNREALPAGDLQLAAEVEPRNLMNNLLKTLVQCHSIPWLAAARGRSV